MKTENSDPFMAIITKLTKPAKRLGRKPGKSRKVGSMFAPLRIERGIFSTGPDMWLVRCCVCGAQINRRVRGSIVAAKRMRRRLEASRG